jgi:hypothetical protein
MLDIIEQKDNQIHIEEKYPEDYTLEHRPTTPPDNRIIHDINKRSTALKSLHNLNRRLIPNQYKEMIDPKQLVDIVEGLDT